MASLSQLLRYLERADIDEVRLQTHAPVSVRQGGQLRPLTSRELTAGQMRSILRGSPVEALLPGTDGEPPAARVDIGGRAYSVRVMRHGEVTQVHIAAGEGASASAPQAAPVQATPVRATPVRARAAPVPQPDPQPRERPQRRPAQQPAPVARPVAAVVQGGEFPRDLEGILRVARSLDASDVHVVGDRPAAVRIAGELLPRGESLSAADVEHMLGALVPDPVRAQLDEAGYCDFAVEVEGAGRLRVNVNRQRTGLKGCFRLVPAKPPTLESLGLPPELAKVTRYHQGLAVVSGPNGQGKTTTMAALVDLLNETKPVHIITVEDPVEIVHPIKRAVVTQRQVGAHTRSFQNALKAALREDPDVIVIGELRDRDTVEMALSAAETGHLVIATMSTPSGAKTIDRLIDMFPPDDQAQVRATLAGALKIVVSQRLVPALDGGRVAAAELITGNIPLWSLIRDNKLFQLPSLLQRGRNFGMIRIEDSLRDLVAAGRISEEVAARYADDPRALAGENSDAAPAVNPGAASGPGMRRGLRNLFGKGGE